MDLVFRWRDLRPNSRDPRLRDVWNPESMIWAYYSLKTNDLQLCLRQFSDPGSCQRQSFIQNHPDFPRAVQFRLHLRTGIGI